MVCFPQPVGHGARVAQILTLQRTGDMSDHVCNDIDSRNLRCKDSMPTGYMDENQHK